MESQPQEKNLQPSCNFMITEESRAIEILSVAYKDFIDGGLKDKTECERIWKMIPAQTREKPEFIEKLSSVIKKTCPSGKI